VEGGCRHLGQAPELLAHPHAVLGQVPIAIALQRRPGPVGEFDHLGAVLESPPGAFGVDDGPADQDFDGHGVALGGGSLRGNGPTP
jgi:hypothetical protein